MLKKDEVREYSIEPADTVPPASGKMNVGKDRDGNLILRQNGQNIIQYNTKIRQLPPDTDPSYQRAGYLHPVWSPAGRILTEINPADHLHHYGIWNPWTSILYDGGMYDLWNLIKKQGTVQLDSILGTTAGDLFSDIRVRHDHVIFRPGEQQTVATPRFSLKITPKEETVILHENLGIRAWATGDNIFMWDFCSDLTPSTDFPVTMKAYRYAGFCFRATADWTAQNCRMMTSEGKTRPEIDGTTARWIWIEGTSPEGDSGILFMSHPANPRHPEPLRVWNAKANKGRGDVMANFSPSKKEDWTLEPGKTYRLRYRVVTYDGRMTSERAEALWQEFAAPPTVTVK